MRHRLRLSFFVTLLSCGDGTSAKPEDRSTATAPIASSSAPEGLLDRLPTSAPEKREPRGPIRITARDEKIVLHATKLDIELIDTRGWLGTAEWGLRLHPQRDGMFVTLGGNVARLEGNVVKFIHQLSGWDETKDILDISGEWPKLAYARVYEDMGKNAPFSRQPSYEKSTGSYFWTGKEWAFTPDASMPSDLVAWSAKSLLGLEKGSLTRVAWPKETPVEDDGRPLPVQQKSASPDKCAGVSVEVSGLGLDTLPTGELYVVGRRCGGAFALEHWKPGSKESVILDLPESPADAQIAYVSAARSDAVFIVLSTTEKVYAARWDGVEVQRLVVELEGRVEAMHAATDGALFFTTRAKNASAKNPMVNLVRIRPSGELTRSASFVGGYGRSLWARDAETAFVESAHASILSTQPGLTFENKAWTSVLGFRPGEYLLPKYEASCTTPFVFLYDVAFDAPPTFAFPKTVVALSTFERVKEISVVEFVIGNRRRLGVSIPNVEVGEEVIAHVKKSMPTERPVMVCYVPKEEVRKVPIPKAAPSK